MRPYYDSWKSSKHGEKNIACVDCHYAPDERHGIRGKFRGLGQFFTYLGTNSKSVRKATRVNDLSCMTSECHPAEQFMDKKMKFTERISYIHATHKNKTIEGQVLHCDTCHQHVQAGKHFEVPRESCFLCHFKNAQFNEDRGKCSLCHEIPAGALQKQKQGEVGTDETPITHESLQKARVSCRSCHYELVQGTGEIKVENCFNCHEYSEQMKQQLEDKKLMHEMHVSAQNAECFDCHRPIAHQKVEFLDPVKESCTFCHPDHHRLQKLLLVGDKKKNVMEAPGLMYDVKTNCIGCHLDERVVKGAKVLHGSAKACAACHTEKHEAMVAEWKEKIEKELKYAKELEQEAQIAIEKAGMHVPKQKLTTVKALVKEGQENVRIVEYGGGVHNKKYAVILLDTAMNNFEAAIEMLSQE